MNTYTIQTVEHRDVVTKQMGFFATVTFVGEERAENVHSEGWAPTEDVAIAKAIRDNERLRGVATVMA